MCELIVVVNEELELETDDDRQRDLQDGTRYPDLARDQRLSRRESDPFGAHGWVMLAQKVCGEVPSST
jgi:hypothetical protein